jgi:hypothetical protein
MLSVFVVWYDFLVKDNSLSSTTTVSGDLQDCCIGNCLLLCANMHTPPISRYASPQYKNFSNERIVVGNVLPRYERITDVCLF